jgi:hypothetical protein
VRRKGAPRNAVLNPCPSQEKFGGILLGQPINLKAKARGDKSMSEKRETVEDAEGVVSQGPCDMVNSWIACPPISSGGTRHTHRYSVSERCCQEQIVHVSRSVASAWQTMHSEGIAGDEWGTYVARVTFSINGTRDRLRDASPKVTESS